MEKFNDKLLNEIINQNISELTDIEKIIFTQQYPLEDNHKDILAKYSVVMMYSIWQSFIVTSFQNYIDELNKKDLCLFSLKDEIVVLHVEKNYNFKNYPATQDKKISLYNRLSTLYKEEKHQLSRDINTESNVNFKVLNRLLETFGLNKFEQHWKGYKHPNPNLEDTIQSFLKVRNIAAHGNNAAPLSEEDFKRYKKLIIDLMYAVQDKMSDGLTTESYLKSIQFIHNKAISH